MKRLFVGALLLVVLGGARAEAASIVMVWGETLGFNLANINNFYNGIANTTSTIAGGQLDTLDLTGVDLLWATQPADDYTAAELGVMASFLAGGGRLAFMGEHGGFSPSQNLRINGALGALGANITINNVMVDPGLRSASVADGQILAHPLTTGVNTYTYAAFAPLALSGTAQALMLGEALDTVMMAYQNIGPGSIFLITDQNVWDGQPGGWPGFDNGRMFENLLLGDTVAPPAVPEPASMALMGVGLVGLALARLRSRRRN
jgi:hypothetical protein